MLRNNRRGGTILLFALTAALSGCGSSTTPVPSAMAPAGNASRVIPGNGKDLPPPPPGHTRNARPESRHTTERKLDATRDLVPAVEARYESVYETVKKPGKP